MRGIFWDVLTPSAAEERMERLNTQGVMHRTSELLIYILPNRREYETTDHANLPPSQEPRSSQ